MSETKQPTMSRRAREAQPFRAMVFGERADEMIARSISVIKLSLGEPDFGAPPAVRDAMREQYDGRALPYTAALGLPSCDAPSPTSTMNAIMSTSTPPHRHHRRRVCRTVAGHRAHCRPRRRGDRR